GGRGARVTKRGRREPPSAARGTRGYRPEVDQRRMSQVRTGASVGACTLSPSTGPWPTSPTAPGTWRSPPRRSRWASRSSPPRTWAAGRPSPTCSAWFPRRSPPCPPPPPATLHHPRADSGPPRATGGKRRQGLQVTGTAGSTLTVGRALGRNAAKIFVPWQLGHASAIGAAWEGFRKRDPLTWASTVTVY